MYSDREHIIHNEVLAQILDVLCHLVNYGYYDSAADVEAILGPLTAMLAGIVIFQDLALLKCRVSPSYTNVFSHCCLYSHNEG